jgi:hypothetical protein
MHQPKNQILRLPFFGKLMIPFLVDGKIMIPISQLGLRTLNERMNITASATARLWFQSRQDYRPTDNMIGF